jgi:hypothetical protein
MKIICCQAALMNGQPQEEFAAWGRLGLPDRIAQGNGMLPAKNSM